MVFALFGCLSSDDSAKNEKEDINIEKEAKDNTEGDGNEGQDDDEECFEIAIDSIRDSTYSWIEEYSDGKKDTVFQVVLYGSFMNPLTPLGHNDSIEQEITPIFGGVMFWPLIKEKHLEILDREVHLEILEVCPGDSLYIYKDLSSIHIYEGDTIYLNYTEEALFDEKPIIPTVEITNKKKILAAMDTLYYGVNGQGVFPEIKRFAYDKADWMIEFITDVQDTILKEVYYSDYECNRENYENFDPCNPTRICGLLVDALSSKAIESNSIPKIEGDELKWRLIASNRFGFADTLEVTSKLVTAVCPAQAE